MSLNLSEATISVASGDSPMTQAQYHTAEILPVVRRRLLLTAFIIVRALEDIIVLSYTTRQQPFNLPLVMGPQNAFGGTDYGTAHHGGLTSNTTLVTHLLTVLEAHTHCSTNRDGCGNEGRALIGPLAHGVILIGRSRLLSYLMNYWPCAGRFSVVNAIGSIIV